MNKKKELDFYSLPIPDQEWFLQQTWCEHCNEADLSMKNPELYIESDVKKIAGVCIVCNTKCISTITTNSVDG